YRSLADIGIKTKTDGTLELDKTKLDKALTDNFDDIGRLFAAAGKPNDAQVRFDSATANTKEGGYDVVVTRLASSGMYTDPDVALGAWPVIVDDSNDTFTIKVDGVTSGILSLGQRAYADGEELAAELQSRINGDSALQEAGVSVGVAFENGRFVFTSDRIGAGSSVEILSVEDATASAGIGLTVKAEARIDGEDVAGTIGGVAALGNGIYLTGKGDADGLKIAIEGAATGNRGTVVFSRGVADKLNSLFDKLLDGESFLNQRTESLNDSIEDIGDQREALERRLESVQQRYMAQFTAMDALIAQLNSTGSFLTQRLASLNTSSQ
ncbi:MAG: flagellar filament capping protein FliD, partial [Thiohalomonadaceae bacterium]